MLQDRSSGPFGSFLVRRLSNNTSTICRVGYTVPPDRHGWVNGWEELVGEVWRGVPAHAKPATHDSLVFFSAVASRTLPPECGAWFSGATTRDMGSGSSNALAGRLYCLGRTL